MGNSFNIIQEEGDDKIISTTAQEQKVAII